MNQVLQYFVSASLWCIYHKARTVQAEEGSIMVGGDLTCALLYCVCGLKAAQMNV